MNKTYQGKSAKDYEVEMLLKEIAAMEDEEIDEFIVAVRRERRRGL